MREKKWPKYFHDNPNCSRIHQYLQKTTYFPVLKTSLKSHTHHFFGANTFVWSCNTGLTWMSPLRISIQFVSHRTLKLSSWPVRVLSITPLQACMVVQNIKMNREQITILLLSLDKYYHYFFWLMFSISRI